MIRQITTNSLNSLGNTEKPQNNQPNFKGLEGLGTVVLSGIQQLEAQPMYNVAAVDLATAIIPRTVVESQTNAYAGLEALRRESSGLIINCLIPGFIVAGIAKLAQGKIMGEGSEMSKCWANQETIEKIAHYWAKADDSAVERMGKVVAKEGKEARAYNALKDLLADVKGADGEAIKSFEKSRFNDSVNQIIKNTFDEKYTDENISAVNKACSKIIKKTHASEHVHIGTVGKEFHGQDLGSVIKNAPYILRELSNGELKGKTVEEFSKEFAKKATSLVKMKSILGLGVIIPLALAAQPINRWITAKTSGKKGAPIYNDFEKTQAKELSPKEKSALFKQKLISVSSIIGVSLLSIGKNPLKASTWKNVTQFKGIFPSMDQARLISTATFASRMASSEDKNDLREATVRDIATFSAFYFLGDYVAKAIATGLQRTKLCKDNGIILINQLKPKPNSGNIFKRFAHWTKDTALKSSDELTGATPEIIKKAKNLRAACQLGNIGFSLLALGLFIPLWNRHQTNKKHQAELKAKTASKQK